MFAVDFQPDLLSHNCCCGMQRRFLQWYVRCAGGPNVSVLAMSGLPRGRGRKGEKPKCQRPKHQTPLPDTYSLRPGLQPIEAGIVNTGRGCKYGGNGELDRTIASDSCSYNSSNVPKYHTLCCSVCKCRGDHATFEISHAAITERLGWATSIASCSCTGNQCSPILP